MHHRTVTDHHTERNFKIPSRVTVLWDTGYVFAELITVKFTIMKL